jgi:rhamnogalacturonan endolyase
MDPARNGGNRAVISCRSFNDPAAPDGMLDMDLRYALGRGEHGLYTCAVWTHEPGWPSFGVGEARYALKLNPAVFDYMTIDADRRRIMPTGGDWDRGEPLNLKEARRMTTGRYRGQAEHKYGYSAVLHETPAYGWSSTAHHVGLWIVNPSMEYLAGGPTKLELTGHLDVNRGGLPTLLNMWLGSHYGGSSLFVGQEASWTKVIGPFLIYCNTASTHEQMWKDALDRAGLEQAAWPYDWVSDADYPSASERASVSGRLTLRDPYAPDLQVSNLWVGLTAPDYSPFAAGGAARLRAEPTQASRGVGQPERPDRSAGSARWGRGNGFPPEVDWQRDAKHYQFWVRAGMGEPFTIPNVRPGTYTLHAIADGVLGEFALSNVVVSPGGTLSLGEHVWTPVHHGRPVWDIGIPNRTAIEFRNGSRAWHWGTYLEYPVDFPDDVHFVIGQSDWRRDWNYVQPPTILNPDLPVPGEQDDDAMPVRALGRAEVRETTWSIEFDWSQPARGRATLRLAFCGTHRGCHVEVLVNGEYVGDTGILPSTSAMQRDSARAYWIEKAIPFEASRLRPGRNVIQLKSHATSWSQGVMYDCLRLEIDEPGRPNNES